MHSLDLHVRQVSGRYPQSGVSSSRNIVVSVIEVARVYVIRLDDEEYPDRWLEITVEVESRGCVSGPQRREQAAGT